MIKLDVNSDSDETIGNWSFDVTSNAFQFCPVFQQIFKTSSNSFSSLEEFFAMCHLDFLDFARAKFDRLLIEGIPFVFDCIIIDQEKKEIWVRFTGTSSSLNDVPITKINGIVRNISNEINLSLRNNTLILALEKLAIISTCDIKGQITHANESFLKATGYTSQELIGNNHRIINAGVHPKSFFKKMWGTILSGRDFHCEITNKTKSGELFWAEAHIYPIKNFRNEIIEFISVRFDITEKKKMQKNELAMAKFQAVGETSAQIMHDVMNPLSIIQGNLKLIQKKSAIDQLDHHYLTGKLSAMNEAALRIIKIFKNMKDLLENNVETEVSSVAENIKKAIDVLELKINKYHICIDDSKIENNQALVKINSQLLLQVLINLINNSCDAIEHLEERWIELSIKSSGDQIILSIRDSGAGIPIELQSKIFDSLFTTKDKDHGTGLGLSVCKRILEKNEGKIALNTESSHTQFDIYLPKSADQSLLKKAA